VPSLLPVKANYPSLPEFPISWTSGYPQKSPQSLRMPVGNSALGPAARPKGQRPRREASVVVTWPPAGPGRTARRLGLGGATPRGSYARIEPEERPGTKARRASDLANRAFRRWDELVQSAKAITMRTTHLGRGTKSILVPGNLF
jgi:hypothetical protein